MVAWRMTLFTPHYPQGRGGHRHWQRHHTLHRVIRTTGRSTIQGNINSRHFLWESLNGIMI